MDEKILVVDDDKSLLKTLENLLGKEGFSVTTTDSSYDALDKIKAEFFDLVILDVRMPGMDGIALLKNIREAQEGAESSRVIIITGFASEETPETDPNEQKRDQEQKDTASAMAPSGQCADQPLT